MQNLELYGLGKVNTQLHARAAALDHGFSESEKTARIMAWNSFIEDHIKLDDSYERVMNVAKVRYGEACELLANYGSPMSSDLETFAKHFYDELFVINKKVTSKGVQAVFYIFVALGIFGLFKLFY
ncbi:hypothetical protein [Pseudomonas sp.]|uniref:hypothetical protein n=1 Tax=Pseudomonas sp. TaxID=306 RepID=UPI002736ACDD|nr:hypothetical protein [Pseudomonas sp.]MDP2745967.1 hypothetical protein [Pseudomonas sp.]